jgi:hypothetical protein
MAFARAFSLAPALLLRRRFEAKPGGVLSVVGCCHQRPETAGFGARRVRCGSAIANNGLKRPVLLAVPADN